MTTKTISAAVSPEMYQALAKMAQKEPRHSKAAVVREALTDFVKRQERNKFLDQTSGILKREYRGVDSRAVRKQLSEKMA